MLLLCLVASTALSYVVFKYVAVSIPRELVGAWRVTDGGLRGATLEFRSDGTAIAIREEKGEKELTHFSAKVEGKTIFLTNRDERTGKEETVKQTILQLQENELVIRDEDKNVFRMRRVQN